MTPLDDGRRPRRAERQRAITAAVMAEGAIRIDELAERFDISLMTVHRDLDDLVASGLLRKARGVATALPTSLVESSDVYRLGRQSREKDELAAAALDLVEPGEAVLLDDSTTVLHLARRLPERSPLTVISHALPVLTDLAGVRDLALVALGGDYTNWCRAFLGRMTVESIGRLRADTVFLSSAAVVDGACFHQSPLIVDVKRAMLAAAARRILLVDHTKFSRRALHHVARLDEFDLVLVDSATDPAVVDELRSAGARIEVAPAGRLDG